MSKTQSVVQDRIPATKIKMAHKDFLDALQHEKARQYIKTIISEYTDSVTFRDVSMKYAGDEIDKRAYGQMKLWAGIIVTSIVIPLIVTFLTNKIWHK